MTREEAIRKAINIVSYFEAHFAKSKEAREDAANIIEALEQEPCEDAISRQAAIDALYKMLHDCFWADDEELDAVITTLKDLPPVIAEKVGHWEKVTVENRDGSISWWYACSECGTPCSKTDHGIDYFGSYCPNCGAKMQEIEE